MEILIKFIDKFYPIASNNYEPEISRRAWYCNCSGVYINELQQKYQKNILWIKEDKCVALTLYKGKYNKYRVYKCGHCIIDVYYLCNLFNAGVQNIEECIKSLVFKCPICEYLGNNINNKYIVYNLYSSGTIISNPIIPEKYLKFIKDDLHPGDVIDTKGYRGNGLYLFDGEFEKVETDNCYPIWPIKWLNKRGYTYYLQLEKTKILYFENDIYYSYNGKFYSNYKDNHDEYNYTTNIIILSDRLNIGDYINFKLYENIIYPFNDYKKLNEIISAGKLCKAKLYNEEFLIFHYGSLYIAKAGIISAILYT